MNKLTGAQRDSLYHGLRDGFVRAVIKAMPGPLARFNNARLHFPPRVFIGAGGIGDDLLCTTVFRELKKRGERRIVIRSKYRSLFQNNPDVDIVIRVKIPIISPLFAHGLNLFQLTYYVPLREHFLVSMSRFAGITGEVDLRPYVFLNSSELAAGRLFDRQIVIQPSGLSASFPMRNKEWYPERFQEVADRLRSKATIIQLGSRSDPPLKGVVDLRDKTSLRESAAILANSMVFVGLVGFLMHLARAVDCRSVIVYGGRETPDMTGYIANKNLVGVTPCSPCWEENKCDYDRECMKVIPAQAAVDAAMEQIARHGSPLEVQVASV